MAAMTVSLPDPMKEWVEAQITNGAYASSSDDVRDLIRRDRERRTQEISIEELRSLVADAKASGVGTRSIDDVFTQAKDIARGSLRKSLFELADRLETLDVIPGPRKRNPGSINADDT